MPPDKKPRGRPKSRKTLEREREEEILRDAPKMDADDTELLEQKLWLIQSGQLEKKLLKQHQSPPMPQGIVWAVESAYDEFMTEEQIAATHEEYTRIKSSIREGQLSGGQTGTDIANMRKHAIFQKNAILIAKLGTRGWPVNRIAQIIHDEWTVIAPHPNLPGESTTLTYRGDGQTRPAVRTISRWLNK